MPRSRSNRPARTRSGQRGWPRHGPRRGRAAAVLAAVALLVFAVLWQRAARRAGAVDSDPTDTPTAAAKPAPPRFDGHNAFALLKKQVAFGPRVPGSAAHQATLTWMTEQLRASCDSVMVHAFQLPDPYHPGQLALTNLKASFRPRLGGRVALAAHWDSRPRADQEPGGVVDKGIPGANDGASGVAVLLELAELMKRVPPPVGVDLLFWDGEDYGRQSDLQYYLLGSKQFAHEFPQYRPRAMILLDMVGDADLRIPMEGYGLSRAPELTVRVFERALALGLTGFVRVPGPSIIDDHTPFLDAGIPAVDLIDFDYPPWHTLEDTPAACSWESLEQVGRLLVSLLYEDFPLDAPR